MASAAPAPALQWLGPRVSFSLDDAGGGTGTEKVGGKPGASSADFEFFLGGCAAASMLPADELFSGGKLVPLRVPAPSSEAPTPTKQATETPRADEAVAPAKGAALIAEEEPKDKVPARRWRNLLRLRKQQQALASEPRPALRRLLRRCPTPPAPEPSLSLPLLTPSPSSPPAPPPPPSSQQQQHQALPPKIRLSAAQQATSPPPPPPPPPPPASVAADSPRLTAAGKVVFHGLGRSASSPSGCRNGTHRGGAIERSYSAHVRVAPVLNVGPVCSLRGSRKSVSVFGIDRLFSSSSPSSSSSSSANPSASAKKARAGAKKEVTAAAAAAAQ